MRRALSLLVVSALLSGCGVQADSIPRDLPDAEQALESSSGSSNTAAGGADRIYLIAPGEERLLRSVRRDAVSAPDLVRILLRGPNDQEIEAQFNTAIPSTTELISARTQGQILTVNLTQDIIELDTQSLVRAIAQIVYTATELDGIEAVQIEIDGEPLSVPTASGTATNVPLRIYDFPNTVQTSQPAFPAAPASATA